jgi:hypothetical protein
VRQLKRAEMMMADEIQNNTRAATGNAGMQPDSGSETSSLANTM